MLPIFLILYGADGRYGDDRYREDPYGTDGGGGRYDTAGSGYANPYD